jgi:hypothetical protein
MWLTLGVVMTHSSKARAVDIVILIIASIIFMTALRVVKSNKHPVGDEASQAQKARQGKSLILINIVQYVWPS